ncbi:hypothetical protein TTRE_0000422101 [Trichuris trichiura]|uniref:Telomere-associated protein Rif1 N-terminal domain-containing protein n=1 Tax=Trichuris trichiura TaxID=36087 RepID=A0A077Z640_TRITR|nr:hypothetical protein TTRE_0000422101 [Trichuris trichiura]
MQSAYSPHSSPTVKAARKMARQIISDLASSDVDVTKKSVDLLYMVVKEQSSLGVFTLDSSTLQLLAAGMPSLDGNRLVTSFAKAMAPMFSSTEKRLQIAAFCLWDELVQAMAVAEKEMFRPETIQQLMLPYIEIKFTGRNDRLIKMKSWWNLLLNFREHLEDHFEAVCYPFLKFCLEAENSGASTADLNGGENDQEVTVDYMPEVLANFLLVNPSGHFDFPRLAPLAVPCFSKVSTVANHADIILEALLIVAPLCCDGQKEFVNACWVTIFDCVGAASGVIDQERHYALCERCAIWFGYFLQRCQVRADELTVLLSLLVPRYMHFPLLQLPVVEENQRTVSLVGLYFISIVLSKDRASSVRSRKLKSWLNTNLDQIVKFLVLDDCAAQLLACFYEEAVILLADDYCYALYYAWRSVVTSLLHNWDKVEKDAASKLWLWLSYAFRHAPYLNKQVELKYVFNHWTLLLDVCPSTCFEMLCIQLIDMAELSANCNLPGQFSASDETTLIALFQFVKDVCLTIRDRNEIIVILKQLTASVSRLVVISDSFVQFSKRSLLEQDCVGIVLISGFQGGAQLYFFPKILDRGDATFQIKPLNGNMTCNSVLSKKRLKGAENVSTKRRFVVSGHANDHLVDIRRQLLPGKDSEDSPIFIALPSPAKLPLVARMPRIPNGSPAPLSTISPSNEDIFDSNTISTINIHETSEPPSTGIRSLLL